MEHQVQVACVNWFREQFPDRLIFAIPNGGLRDKRTAKGLRAEGVLAGVPDMQVPEPCNGYHGLWLEMKYGHNTTSKAQKAIIEQLAVRGYKVAVCYSLEEFKEAVYSYFGMPVPKEHESERDELKAFLYGKE